MSARRSWGRPERSPERSPEHAVAAVAAAASDAVAMDPRRRADGFGSVGVLVHPRAALAAAAARVARPGAIYLASRAGVLLVAAATSADGGLPFAHALLAWDGRWYTAAAAGYPHHLPQGHGDAAQSALGFFPVLPLLIAAVHLVLGVGYQRAGLLTTFGAGLVAAALVWWLVADTDGPSAADRGVALVLFSPGAFVLSMIYSEGVLLSAVAGSLLALRRRRWVLAGVLAGVASGTDPLGVAMVPACAVAAAVALRRGDRRSLWAPLLAPSGVVGFFAFLWAWTGTPLAWFVAQRRGWQAGAPFTSIPGQFGWLWDFGLANPNITIKAASFLVVGGLLVAFLRLRPEWPTATYVLGALALAAASPVIGWSPRVALRAFPLLALVGARLPRSWFPVVLGTSALVMAAVAAMAFGAARVPFTP